MKRSGESEWERETEKEKKKRGMLLDSSGLSFTHSFFLFPSFLLSSLKERAPSFPFIPFATMPLYQVAIPAIVLAHAIGLALLLYSLEKVSGIVSRTTRRLSWKKKGATSPSASSAPESAEAGRANNHSVRSLQPSPTKSIHNTVKSKGWIRGCACTVSSIIGAFFCFFFLFRERRRASERSSHAARQLGAGSGICASELSSSRPLDAPPLLVRSRAYFRCRPFRSSDGASGPLRSRRARWRGLEKHTEKSKHQKRLARFSLRIQ